MGYVLRAGFDVPPIMFDAAEIEAVVLGLQIAAAWGGARLEDGAARASRKIEAVLPSRSRERLAGVTLMAPGFHVPAAVRALFDRLHAATEAALSVELSYADASGGATVRRVRPLGLLFWGGAWTLAAWCELRSDFRSFRLDRIQAAETVAAFEREPARDLAAFLRAARSKPDDPKAE